mgnify:CR=1 FL=1
MDVKIASDWKKVLAPEFEKTYFTTLTDFVRQEYATRRIYPRGSNIFRAFDKCPFDRLKVVIIGQDPYHGPGQANGLCFSVADGIPFPPSLQNIFKEVADDTGTPIPASGNLDRWAEQGVLLLSKPFSNTLFVQAMHMAAASNHRLQRLRQENARLQDKISQIRLVSRAKCCLVEHAHLTEAEAHRRIEKLAMDTRRDRTEIAQEILDSYEDVGV